MKLPNADRAVIDRSKVVDYLLSEAHVVGRFKSAFFTTLGYSKTAWEVLAADIQRHAFENEALATEANQYGQKYEVHGNLDGPASRAAVLITVWIVLHGEDFPRFVTAYPGSKR